MRYFLIFLWFIFSLISIPKESISNDIPKIRILICKDVDKIVVNGDDTTIITLNKKGILINNKYISAKNPIIFNGPVKINNNRYKGVVEIHKGDSGIDAINEIDIEDYLVGLINREISSKWNIESIKAFSIAARTYAIYKKMKNNDNIYDLKSSIMDQVYDGIDYEDSRSYMAVKETKGEVLTYNGEIIFAPYHSECGGKRESSLPLWNEYHPYLSNFLGCIKHPHSIWGLRISKKELINSFISSGYIVGDIRYLKVTERSESDRVLKIKVYTDNGDIEIKGDMLRSIMGYNRLKSSNFDIAMMDDDIIFLGKGAGHGVGLCQIGTREMGEKGYNYKNILMFYYNNTEIKRLY